MPLNFFETETAIQSLKIIFEKQLSSKLNLTRASAPKFIKVGKGLQDDLAGTQVPVSFLAKNVCGDQKIEIVHSLAKWKRHYLGQKNYSVGEGLFTDMDAIRKDEIVDEIHSIYVDQWDWEKVVSKEQRNIKYLKDTVSTIYDCIKTTELMICAEYGYNKIKPRLSHDIKFIHSQELEDMYPDIDPSEREGKILQKMYEEKSFKKGESPAIFLIGIGNPLKSKMPHDVRAFDYDDWITPNDEGFYGLNGDILIWDQERMKPLEISSMGIRVDDKSLKKQIEFSGEDLNNFKEKEFHKGILENTTPLSIGGGIGQSRLSMLLLQKQHIGEVQTSIWPDEMIQDCLKKGITLL